jgi:hypothetical protein
MTVQKKNAAGQTIGRKRGSVIRIAHITRAMVKADRASLFVFGDNMEGRGFGGQAAAMRGELNTIWSLLCAAVDGSGLLSPNAF